MIPKEIFSQIRQIEIKTGKLVNDVFAGQYSSVFKGRGMEFAEVREYQAGDDIRSIDWNVTARMGHPFVKRFVEERELTVFFVVDMSASHKFGTQEKFKSNIAAEITSILAFSAMKNNDKVGMLVFTDEVENYVIPKKGRAHILRMIRDILYYEPKNVRTNMKTALEYLNDIAKRKAVVFIISDFACTGYEKLLRITGKRHDLISIVLQDPREKQIPVCGIVRLKDAETGQEIEIDTSNYFFRKSLEQKQNEVMEDRERIFRTSGLDYINISTGASYVEPLIRFFKQRERRFR